MDIILDLWNIVRVEMIEFGEGECSNVAEFYKKGDIQLKEKKMRVKSDDLLWHSHIHHTRKSIATQRLEGIGAGLGESDGVLAESLG